MSTVKLQDTNNIDFYYEFDPKDETSILGKGGMGVVFKGKRIHDETGKFDLVAIKVLFNDLDEESIERAKREASIQIEHENLLRMYDFIEIKEPSGKSKNYVISEYLEGETLSDLLKQKSRFEWRESLQIIKSILAGLYMLHEKGYLHRDIDPSNIIVCKNGGIKIIDFGIAKDLFNSDKFKQQTVDGRFIGKVFYASPEQINGDSKLLQKSTVDIYSVGIILYELLTGKLPYSGTTYEIIKGHLEKPTPLKNIDSEVSCKQEKEGIKYLIERSTQKDQTKRYQTPTEFILDIEKVLKGENPIPAASFKWIYLIAIALLILAIGIWQYFEHREKLYTRNVQEAKEYLSVAIYNKALQKFNEAYSIKNTDSIKAEIEMLKILSPAVDAYTSSDYILADSLFKEAAKLNSSDAYYYLGEMSYDGIGIPKQIKQGIRYTQQAANLTNGLAFYRLGVIYQEGRDTIKIDEDKAIKYFEKAKRLVIDNGVEANNPELLNIKGDMYLNGYGVIKNKSMAKEYFSKAANMEYPVAQFSLYQLLEESDEEEAAKWLIESAKNGYPKAQYELGHYYLEKAEYGNFYNWISTATEGNYAPALRDMGAFYQEVSNSKELKVRKAVLKESGIHPNDSISMNYLTMAVKFDPFYEKGRYSLALQEVHLARKFKKSGNKQKSIEFLERAKNTVKKLPKIFRESTEYGERILATNYNKL